MVIWLVGRANKKRRRTSRFISSKHAATSTMNPPGSRFPSLKFQVLGCFTTWYSTKSGYHKGHDIRPKELFKHHIMKIQCASCNLNLQKFSQGSLYEGWACCGQAVLLFDCFLLGLSLMSHKDARCYMRCPCIGHGVGCVWLLLLKPNAGGD